MRLCICDFVVLFVNHPNLHVIRPSHKQKYKMKITKTSIQTSKQFHIIMIVVVIVVIVVVIIVVIIITMLIPSNGS